MNTMLLALIAVVPSSLAAVAAIIGARKVGVLHDTINSKMDRLLVEVIARVQAEEGLKAAQLAAATLAAQTAKDTAAATTAAELATTVAADREKR